MKTVGDVIDEIERIQHNIRELTDMYTDREDSPLCLKSAIFFLSNYTEVLRELQIKEVRR